MAEPQRLGPGFPPVCGKESRVLILGSFPSVKSREVGFYYGHPQNRFWPLLARLLEEPLPATTEEKKALILRRRLALWDTVRCCTITGASDASIRDVEPNDIPALLRRCPVETILCNGAASWKIYQKYALPATGLPALKMPSTSPANAAWSLERLADSWGPALTQADIIPSRSIFI